MPWHRQSVIYSEKDIVVHIPAELFEYPGPELSFLAGDIPVARIKDRAPYGHIALMPHPYEKFPEI